MRYATSRNVCGKPISDLKVPFLLEPVASALSEAASMFRMHGFKIVIWDAARTKRTQALLRDYLDDDQYVAVNSNHNTGTAIDMTLIDSKGVLLDMGTDFDDFSPVAWSSNQELSDDVVQNRKLLKDIMAQAKFKQLDTEWWHFDYTGVINGKLESIEQYV